MKFYVKQKVFSLKDKFFIKDENQKEMYQVQGKFMSLSNKLELQNLEGEVILKSHKKVFSLSPTYFIFDKDDHELVTIRKKVFSIRPKFTVTKGHTDLMVEGSLFAHSFQIVEGTNVLASIQKKVFSFGDSYEIIINDERDTEVFLFIVIIIDQVIHEQQRRRTHNG